MIVTINLTSVMEYWNVSYANFLLYGKTTISVECPCIVLFPVFALQLCLFFTAMQGVVQP